MTDEHEERVNKSGRWTKLQEQFMKDNCGKMTIDDMAAQLEKNPITVRKYCVEKLGTTPEEKILISAKFDIQKSPIWQELKNQFTPGEMETFLYTWQNIMVQFKHDVLPTERMQMIEISRLEVLINRVMSKMKESDVILRDAQKEIDTEKKLGDLKDESKIIQLQQITAQMNASHGTLTREYRELLERKQSILKEIRGTREQRIKRIEETKETIQSWMAKLVDNEELRRTMGIEMRKGQLALYKELERLGEFYQYDDGSVERLITNSETVKEGD